MNNLTLVKLFEHNLWANQQIIQACYALSDEQLDAEPQSATKGSIRQTLTHCVRSVIGAMTMRFGKARPPMLNGVNRKSTDFGIFDP